MKRSNALSLIPLLWLAALIAVPLFKLDWLVMFAISWMMVVLALLLLGNYRGLGSSTWRIHSFSFLLGGLFSIGLSLISHPDKNINKIGLTWLIIVCSITILFILAFVVLTIVRGKGMSEDVSRVEVVWRESGPICYSVQIILNSALRASLPGALLASGLNCYWDCSPLRSLTQLTAQSAVLLAEDLDVFAETFSSSITIFGFAHEADEIVANSFEDLQPLLRLFSVQEAGPLAIVIVQEGDDVFEAVFVAHNPTTAVRYLLEVWGVSKETISHTQRDSNIRGVFEKLFDLPPRNLIL